MTKKTIYIANDGTEFENKKECREYENRYKLLSNSPEVMFFDEDLEPLAKYSIKDDDDFWYNLFIRSHYINIPSVECFDLLQEAYNEFLGEPFTSCDFTDSDNKIGLWKYNNLEECWENLIEVKAQIARILEQANEIVLKEKESYGKEKDI